MTGNCDPAQGWPRAPRRPSSRNGASLSAGGRGPEACGSTTSGSKSCCTRARPAATQTRGCHQRRRRDSQRSGVWARASLTSRRPGTTLGGLESARKSPHFSIPETSLRLSAPSGGRSEGRCGPAWLRGPPCRPLLATAEGSGTAPPATRGAPAPRNAEGRTFYPELLSAAAQQSKGAWRGRDLGRGGGSDRPRGPSARAMAPPPTSFSAGRRVTASPETRPHRHGTGSLPL